MKRTSPFTVVIPTFDVTNPSTWPAVLTPEHVSAIYDRPVGGIKKACQQGRFTPAPYKTFPYRWRKVDVLRDVEGARPMSLRRPA